MEWKLEASSTYLEPGSDYGELESSRLQWRHAVTGVDLQLLLHYRKVEIPRAFIALSLARKGQARGNAVFMSLLACILRRESRRVGRVNLRNINSHAVPFCNNDQQSEGQEKEVLCSWSTAYICKSKPEARVKGSTRKRGGRTSSPSSGDAPYFPSTIIIREVRGAGRSWLDGQTGRATLWRRVDL